MRVGMCRGKAPPKYLALYDTVDAQVLQSDPYLAVLGNSTAWTQHIRPHFQNFVHNGV